MSEALMEPVVAVQPDTAAMARCIGELPALPRALLAAVRVLSQDNVPAGECIDAIERDQALATRMLRLANSAFYGARGQVSSIGDAVQMLGMRTVASVVAAVSLRSTLAQLKCEAFSFEAYWQHALSAAIIARELSRPAAHDPGEAFLAALLHDVGQLILVMSHPEQAERALQLSQETGIDLYESERQVIGISHDAVGADVARHWHFPASIVSAIAAHHTPLPPEPGDRLSLSALIHLADALAQRLDSGEHSCGVPGDEDTRACLQLTEDSLQQLFARTEQEIAAFSAT
jgi:putative nucleotidyltransferase with HDIG domain